MTFLTFCPSGNADSNDWRTTDEVEKGEIAVIEPLQPGVTYDLQVLAVSEHGEAFSSVAQIYCCEKKEKGIHIMKTTIKQREIGVDNHRMAQNVHMHVEN